MMDASHPQVMHTTEVEISAAASSFPRATPAGNLATASPISDMNPLLAACGAEIVLMSARAGERRVKVRDFFLGYVF